MIQETQVLWKTESAAYNPGANLHQWFARDNTFYAQSPGIPDQPTGPGVWHKINMAGFNHLRIYGDIVPVDIGARTTTDIQIRPYAMGRGPTPEVQTLVDNEQFLGKLMADASADIAAGTTRLTNVGWYLSLGTKAIYAGICTLNNSAVLYNGGNDFPLANATQIVLGERRMWHYDVVDGYVGPTNKGIGWAPGAFPATVHSSTTDAPIAITQNLGKVAGYCEAWPYVYVALKTFNAAAVAGTGTLAFADQITAQKTQLSGGRYS